jgi:hypothetical protein
LSLAFKSHQIDRENCYRLRLGRRDILLDFRNQLSYTISTRSLLPLRAEVSSHFSKENL